MSDGYDGLKLCYVCGDAYTLSGMCGSCSRQAMIDRIEGAQRLVKLPVVYKVCPECDTRYLATRDVCPSCDPRNTRNKRSLSDE